MLNKDFFFSEDGFKFIRLSEIIAITPTLHSHNSYTVYLNAPVPITITVDSDTVTELFEALRNLTTRRGAVEISP
jgi:hypothetical protein